MKDQAPEMNLVTVAFPKVVREDCLDGIVKHAQQQVAATIRANALVVDYQPTPVMLTLDHKTLQGYSQQKVAKHVGRIVGRYLATNGCYVVYPEATPTAPPPPPPQQYTGYYFQQPPPPPQPPQPTMRVWPTLPRPASGEYVDMTIGRYGDTTGKANSERP